MRVTSNGKVRRTSGEWDEILTMYRGSGLTQQKFCTREGLSVTSLQKQLRIRGDTKGKGERAQFVELTGKPEQSDWDVELTLNTGLVLRLRG